jgi:NAD/NADP transhydrogenase beta subunit
MKLREAELLPQYAKFLSQTQRNVAALNAYKRAKDIYAMFGIKRVCDTLQVDMDGLLARANAD